MNSLFFVFLIVLWIVIVTRFSHQRYALIELRLLKLLNTTNPIRLSQLQSIMMKVFGNYHWCHPNMLLSILENLVERKLVTSIPTRRGGAVFVITCKGQKKIREVEKTCR